MSYSEKVLERILNLPFEKDYLDSSVIDLMREYIRRMAIICKPLGIRSRNPFFDVAEMVNPEVRANPQDLEKVSAYIKEKTHPIFYNVHTVRVCEWALHFAALQDENGGSSIIESPYEPLIVIYERNGSFSVKGEIMLGVADMQIADWWNRNDPNPIVNLGD
jgi:hypothetical protein